MYGYQYWISFPLALLVLTDAATGNCLFPGEVEDATVVAKTLKASYDTGDLLLYECDEKGASHVARYCQSDRTWTAADRQCSDSHLWNYGALAGVLVAALNYFVAIFAVGYSQAKFKASGKKPDQDSTSSGRT